MMYSVPLVEVQDYKGWSDSALGLSIHPNDRVRFNFAIRRRLCEYITFKSNKMKHQGDKNQILDPSRAESL
jgi:hypothetical protein